MRTAPSWSDLNRDNSWYARRAMIADQQVVIERAAEAMGVLPEEIGLCRNAAEGLSALISQFRDVGPGDRDSLFRYRL